MYRIAVCDDEQADASYVEHFIKKWAQEHAVMVQVELFPSAEAFLFRYEEVRTFDMLFLDIEMHAAGAGAPDHADGMRESNESFDRNGTSQSDETGDWNGMSQSGAPEHADGTSQSDESAARNNTDQSDESVARSGGTSQSDESFDQNGTSRSGTPGHMNGIELALRIREREHDRAVQIVFVTGYMDYIEKGYDVEALHYLLKPVTQERLFGVLDRAAQRVRDRGRELCLQMPEGTARIPVSEIRYLEVQRNYVTIHGDEDYTVKRTLGELERELDGRFFRTGRSYIVNLQFVKKITRSQIVLKDGAQIPLPRRAYEDINRAMIRYF